MCTGYVCVRARVCAQEVKAEPYGKVKDGSAFRVRAPTRTYEFRAATSDEANEWVAQINAAAAAAPSKGGGVAATAAARAAAAAAAAAADSDAGSTGGGLSSLIKPRPADDGGPSPRCSVASEVLTSSMSSSSSSATSGIPTPSSDAGTTEAAAKKTGWTRRMLKGMKGAGGGGRDSVATGKGTQYAPPALTTMQQQDSWCDISAGAGSERLTPQSGRVDTFEEMIAEEAFGSGSDPTAPRVSGSL